MMTALNPHKSDRSPAIAATAPLAQANTIDSLAMGHLPAANRGDAGVSLGMPGYQVVAHALSQAEPGWSFELDVLDVHSCSLDELHALHESAPNLCLRGFLSGVLSGRAELALLTGRTGGQPASWVGDADFDLKARLERRFRQWAGALDRLHLFSSPTCELQALLDQAPHEYYAGFLAGVLSMRASIACLTGRKGN